MCTRNLLLFSLLFIGSCSPRSANESQANPSVDGAAIKAHIQKLASNEMEGRAPASKGEELATAYIADFYKSIGLKTQFQDVPMIGITSTVSPMRLMGKGGNKSFRYLDDFMAWSRREDAD